MRGRSRDPSTGRGSTETSWYQAGLRFECTRWGKCCRGAPGYVWVSEEEVGRIARFLGMEEADVGRRFVRRVGERLSLKERGDGDCIFYRDGCLIYPVRPTQCVTFPFWQSNVRTPGDWDRLGAECPGVNRGRLWSEADIRMSLRADRASTAGEAQPVPVVTDAVLSEFRRRYHRLDRGLASLPEECDRCGECCQFGEGVPTLYASLAEAALVLRWSRRWPRRVGQTCPFLHAGRCTVHPVRPLGCRTHFWRDDHREEHEALSERTLGELKEVCRRGLVPWRYEPLLALLRELAAGHL